MKITTGLMKQLSIYEIIVIALMAALGLATKPLIVPLVHLITGPLFIPGGSVAGGFYMMWIILGAAIVGKRGSATMIAFTQALIVLITGAFGTHGIISIVTYTIPGFMVDGCFSLVGRSLKSPLEFFFAGIIANLSGTYLSNLVFFRLPLVPLILSLASGALSGGLGGLIAYSIYKRIKQTGLADM